MSHDNDDDNGSDHVDKTRSPIACCNRNVVVPLSSIHGEALFQGLGNGDLGGHLIDLIHREQRGKALNDIDLSHNSTPDHHLR